MLVLGFLSNGQPVIAAVATNDQGAAIEVLDSSSEWLLWWTIPVAIVSLVIFTQIPDWRLKKTRLLESGFSSSAGLLLFAAALIGGVLGASIATHFVLPPMENGGNNLAATLPIMVGNYVGQGFVFLLVPGLILGRKQSRGIGRRMSWWRAVLAGCLGMAIAMPITLAVAQVAGFLIELSTGQTFDEIGHGTLLQIKEAAEHPDLTLVVIAIMVVIVTPIWEEVLYRGMLQESIRKHPLARGESPWTAIVITSLIFAAMHGGVVDFRGLFALFVLSLGFGWIYMRTGRLTACIAMHAAFNAFNILLVIL